MTLSNSSGHARGLPDHYRTLGVAPTASFREIEAAYWRLAYGARPERVAELNAAYEVLGSEQRRAAYDADRPQAPEPAPDPERPAHASTRREAASLVRRLGWPRD
jgi:curved DNA-binding protein CbpA